MCERIQSHLKSTQAICSNNLLDCFKSHCCEQNFESHELELEKITETKVFAIATFKGEHWCGRDVRDQFLHVETETETFCTQSQFLILRLRLLKLVSNFETETL